MMALIVDTVIGKAMDFLLGLSQKIPAVKNFHRSRELSKSLERYQFLFNVSYSYSLHAFCLAVNGPQASRAVAVYSNIVSLSQLSPTLFNKELSRRLVELKRIVNETRELIRSVGSGAKVPNYPQVYSQLQPRLNEFMLEVEKIAQERLTRFPADISFIHLV